MTIHAARLRRASAIMATASLWAIPAPAQGPALAMLDRIEPGRWELRPRNAIDQVQNLCIASGRRLIQLRHPNVTCESYVVDDGASDVTVQYTCHGRGYGRTHIRRESGRLVQIESQGIADGYPFDFVAEGRRLGDCAD